MTARILVLPVIRIERSGVNFARQMAFAADRSKVIDLWRVRLERDQADLCEVAAQYSNPCRQL